MSVTILPYSDIVTHLASLVCQQTGGAGKIWVLICYSTFYNVSEITGV